jgi:hypothetical protein
MPRKISQMKFEDGVLAIQTINSDDSINIYVALASSLVNCYSFDGMNNEIVLQWSLKMITCKDHSSFPLSHFQVTSKYSRIGSGKIDAI